MKPLLLWTSNEYYIFWVCVCSLRYLACNAHAPYCHLWPVLLYDIFPHYLINGKIFQKTLLNTKCVFWFSLQLLSETFQSLRRNKWDIDTCISVCFMYSARYSCQIVTNLNFSRNILERYSNMLFYKKNPPSVKRSVPCRQSYSFLLNHHPVLTIFMFAPCINIIKNTFYCSNWCTLL